LNYKTHDGREVMVATYTAKENMTELLEEKLEEQ